MTLPCPPPSAPQPPPQHGRLTDRTGPAPGAPLKEALSYYYAHPSRGQGGGQGMSVTAGHEAVDGKGVPGSASRQRRAGGAAAEEKMLCAVATATTVNPTPEVVRYLDHPTLSLFYTMQRPPFLRVYLHGCTAAEEKEAHLLCLQNRFFCLPKVTDGTDLVLLGSNVLKRKIYYYKHGHRGGAEMEEGGETGKLRVRATKDTTTKGRDALRGHKGDAYTTFFECTDTDFVQQCAQMYGLLLHRSMAPLSWLRHCFEAFQHVTAEVRERMAARRGEPKATKSHCSPSEEEQHPHGNVWRASGGTVPEETFRAPSYLLDAPPPKDDVAMTRPPSPERAADDDETHLFLAPPLYTYIADAIGRWHTEN
ncbi:hypothetical protein STCU_11554 [Strigomonas culicis]|uniref:Uncharacterized protein n=1 Tax=Strigomonas culicis TaxID=28005 RepID=S9TGU1_9TRYP|nr:hypothetical protein STCU_11554 [Strigomonas culicis]|eukprot:EPY16099.1 hypothetical protein STCU_11554 [Strigomonas culicis]